MTTGVALNKLQIITMPSHRPDSEPIFYFRLQSNVANIMKQSIIFGSRETIHLYLELSNVKQPTTI